MAPVPQMTLVIIEGGEAERELSVTSVAVIGRDPGVDLVITDADVSARHASLTPLDAGFAIEDLGSTNGTFVNGRRLAAAQEIRAGDRIQLGGPCSRCARTLRRPRTPCRRPFPRSR